MFNIESYSIGVFIIVLISGCAVNFIRQHYIIQLTGIAVLFTCTVLRLAHFVNTNMYTSLIDAYNISLPMLSGISACLVSMALGFWIFPVIRKKRLK